jgi:hypothetical protein
MKLKAPEDLLHNIRELIRSRRQDLDYNRSHRKQLIRDIQEIKKNIKAGERICSIIEAGVVVETPHMRLQAGLAIDTTYLRDDLKKKRETLNHVRQTLLAAEVDHVVFKSICRTLHEQLDRMNEPFDPTRAKTAGRPQQ